MQPEDVDRVQRTVILFLQSSMGQTECGLRSAPPA
jgi:hypothetical protein